jgi:hypothetical protein
MPRGSTDGQARTDRCFEFAIRAGSMPPAAPKAKSNAMRCTNPDLTKPNQTKPDQTEHEGPSKKATACNTTTAPPLLEWEGRSLANPVGATPSRSHASTHAFACDSTRRGTGVPGSCPSQFGSLSYDSEKTCRTRCVACVVCGFVAACSVQSGGDRDLFGVCHLHLHVP